MLPSPHMRGQQAYQQEMDLADNPFNAITHKLNHADWKRGWKLARRNDPLAPHDDEEDDVADAGLETGFESDD